MRKILNLTFLHLELAFTYYESLQGDPRIEVISSAFSKDLFNPKQLLTPMRCDVLLVQNFFSCSNFFHSSAVWLESRPPKLLLCVCVCVCMLSDCASINLLLVYNFCLVWAES